jgi:AcrR family transcriptional regulator
VTRRTATLEAAPRRRKPIPAAEAQDAIVEAAAECFARLGIERTRIEDIAQRAGIARPNVYRHFAGKDAIVHAVALREIDRQHQRLAKRFTHDGPAAELIIGSLVSGIRDAAFDTRSLTRSESAHITARGLASSPEILEAVTSYWEPLLEYARERGELREDVEIQAAARWLLFVQFSYLAIPELVPDGDQLEANLRSFVLPSLLKV